MLLFLVCWLVVSVVAGAFVGMAIHRADVLEQRRVPYPRAAAARSQPDAPDLTGYEDASSSASVPHVQAVAA